MDGIKSIFGTGHVYKPEENDTVSKEQDKNKFTPDWFVRAISHAGTGYAPISTSGSGYAQ